MIQLETLKSSGHFKQVSLKKGEVLFQQGDINNNLYIVYSGELAVRKEVTLQKGDFKTLSILHTGNIVGEAALSHNQPKQVQIIAKNDTILLFIDGKNNFPKFVAAYPEEGYTLLTNIIDIVNNRLLRANSELTANYEVNVAISKIKDVSISSIYKLLLVFESILGVDQIMYFEKNLVMDKYYKLRYDSKNEKSLRNTIIKFPEETLDFEILKNENIEVSKYKRFIKLSLGEEDYGFILIGKDANDFHENEEKLLRNTAGSFVGIIHQKSILDEARNKKYMKSSL